MFTPEERERIRQTAIQQAKAARIVVALAQAA
jgi:hypothetical protein